MVGTEHLFGKSLSATCHNGIPLSSENGGETPAATNTHTRTLIFENSRISRRIHDSRSPREGGKGFQRTHQELPGTVENCLLADRRVNAASRTPAKILSILPLCPVGRYRRFFYFWLSAGVGRYIPQFDFKPLVLICTRSVWGSHPGPGGLAWDCLLKLADFSRCASGTLASSAESVKPAWRNSVPGTWASDGFAGAAVPSQSFLKEGERHVGKFEVPSVVGCLPRVGRAGRLDSLPGAGLLR